MDRYIVYIRKSTDTEDRQVLSLESQKRVITEDLIVPQNISPFTWYEESKSAKAPGRPKFDEMIENINKGKVTHVICWQLNRLARNSVDGGRLIWFVQNDIIKIVTPVKNYDKNDILLLYVEFAMANQFSNDLSKSVLRGLEDKVRKGIAPILAPLGYYNDMSKPKGLKDILPDEKRFPLVRKMWDLLLTGKMTPTLIYKIASKQWGLKHRNGKPLSRTQTYDLFHNIFYAGQFYYQGEIHPGIHRPAAVGEVTAVDDLRSRGGHVDDDPNAFECPPVAADGQDVGGELVGPAGDPAAEADRLLAQYLRHPANGIGLRRPGAHSLGDELIDIRGLERGERQENLARRAVHVDASAGARGGGSLGRPAGAGRASRAGRRWRRGGGGDVIGDL